MFSPLRFRSPGAIAWPLGALLLASGSPARAQSAAPATPPATLKPQFTLETRPASAIAATHRPKVESVRAGRALLMAFPSETPIPAATSPQAASVQPAAALASASPTNTKASAPASLQGAPATGLSGNASPQTLISPAKRVKVTSKTRFDASRVSTQTSEVASSTGASPMGASPTGAIETAPSIRAAQPTATTSTHVETLPTDLPRDHMARLPSRGGMVNRAPVELQPAAPDTTAITDSQRRLLASLDADLGRAQRRLDRAETRLSEGQRQLGAFTGVLQTAMLDAGPDARGLHPFVRVAQRYMGTPYVWGGESARGFDCSGFIMRVMRDLGYRALPHSAAEQFGYGLPVARALLKPGDIVFFANTYKPGISHVGIYLGRGRFIHAANSKVGTIVSNLDSPKWVEHYAGARRLLPVKS